MATIMCLSQEVITIILGYNDISIEDIINFRCVCKQFRWAAKYDKYMEKKFSQRWPSAKKLYDKQSKKNEQESEEQNKQKDKQSLNFMETGINCTRQLRNFISQIIHRHYSNSEEISNVTCRDKDERLMNNISDIVKPKNFIKYSFFIDEMKNLLTQSPRRTGCDLTERYFNSEMFEYMRRQFVKGKLDVIWHWFLRPQIHQFLERIVTMIAQWLQPEKDIFYSCIKASLNSIALEVLNCLKEKHPDHLIFSTSAEMFSYWENNNIDNNHWNEAEGMQIIDTLEEYIFSKLNFRPSKWNDTNVEYMCIDNVLKNKYGQEYILLIIYHSVARRLGLRCDVMCIERCQDQSYYFCIAWKPNYATNNSENIRCFNISSKKFPDCLVSKQVLHFSTLIRTLLSKDFNELQVMDLMMKATKQFWNVLIYKIFTLMGCKNYNWVFGLKRDGTINYITQDNLSMLSLRVKETKLLHTRPKDVKFAVGMIVTHQPTNCAGVIVGWQRYLDKCIVTISINNVPVSYVQMYNLPLNHCRNHNFIKQQTNYIILTENNQICYVEEDVITLTTKWINNSEIGRYFCKFEGTHYVPNKMLARFYPQDAAITAQTTLSKN